MAIDYKEFTVSVIIILMWKLQRDISIYLGRIEAKYLGEVTGRFPGEIDI